MVVLKFWGSLSYMWSFLCMEGLEPFTSWMMVGYGEVDLVSRVGILTKVTYRLDNTDTEVKSQVLLGKRIQKSLTKVWSSRLFITGNTFNFLPLLTLHASWQRNPTYSNYLQYTWVHRPKHLGANHAKKLTSFKIMTTTSKDASYFLLPCLLDVSLLLQP